MKIGVIGAMECEVEYLRDRMANLEVTRRMGMELCDGTLNGKPVALVCCGDGKVNAALNAMALSYECGVTHIVNTGVAGSLDTRLGVGDIVVSTKTVEHDFDVTPLGYEPGFIPSLSMTEFASDERMRKIAVRAARSVAKDARVLEGCVASGDRFVSSPREKERIVSTFGALCCEMEGAAIAHACQIMGMPYVVVRVMSDNADGSSHVDYRTFVDEAAKRSAAIVERMIDEL